MLLLVPFVFFCVGFLFYFVDNLMLPHEDLIHLVCMSM